MGAAHTGGLKWVISQLSAQLPSALSPSALSPAPLITTTRRCAVVAISLLANSSHSRAYSS